MENDFEEYAPSGSCKPFDDFDETGELDIDYGAGKLHPVHFGDVFSKGRYKVIRKLGAGSYSTVWLVRDRTSVTGASHRVLESLLTDRSDSIRTLLSRS